MYRTLLGTLTLLTALALGCSGADVAEDEKSDDAAGQPAVAVTTTSASGKAPSKGQSPDEVITPFEDNLDFFSPPKIAAPVLPPDPVDDDIEPSGPQPLPPTRLVGFVNVGNPKAMLSIDGAVNVVSAGESIRSMEIVAVEAPAVTLKHGGQEITLDLFTRPALAQRGANRRSPVTHRRGGRAPASDQSPPPRAAPSIPALPGLSSPGANPPPSSLPPASPSADATAAPSDILDPAGGFPGLPPAP